MRGDVRTDVPSSSLLAGPVPFPSSQVGSGNRFEGTAKKTGGTSGAAEREEPQESRRGQQGKGPFEGKGEKERDTPSDGPILCFPLDALPEADPSPLLLVFLT